MRFAIFLTLAIAASIPGCVSPESAEAPADFATTEQALSPNEAPRCVDFGCGIWDVDDLGCVGNWVPYNETNCTCSVDTGNPEPCHFP